MIQKRLFNGLLNYKSYNINFHNKLFGKKISFVDL